MRFVIHKLYFRLLRKLRVIILSYRIVLLPCYSIPADPNTQILYACDSCGEKFLDASSLAQHVRIHTAQALVMFQADSDFYQQYTGDATWQTTEQVIQGGELLFRTRDEESEEAQPESQMDGAEVETEEGAEKVHSESQQQ